MKFTSSFLAIGLAIGHVAAIPISDVSQDIMTFTYWPQPSYQGVSTIISVNDGQCTNTSVLPIQSVQISKGICTLYNGVTCSGVEFTFDAPQTSIPQPLAGNVTSYICAVV